MIAHGETCACSVCCAEPPCDECGGEGWIDFACWSPARSYFTVTERCEACNPEIEDETGAESATDARDMRAMDRE